MAKRLKKDRLTVLHQWVTVIGAPVISTILAAALIGIWNWAGTTSDTLNKLTVTVGFMSQAIGQHSTELKDLNNKLDAAKAKLDAQSKAPTILRH